MCVAGQSDPYYQTGGFPSEIFKLTKLKVLDLSYQALLKAPEEFKSLQGLVRLGLSHNPQLEGIGDVGAPPDLKGARDFHTLYYLIVALYTVKWDFFHMRLIFVYFM